MSDADPIEPLRQSVYLTLRSELITGVIEPQVGMSTRGIAERLGVSQTPVREALSRLAAEGAVTIRNKRAIIVPPMTRERLDDIALCRLMLEPEAAARALQNIGRERLRKIRQADDAIEQALQRGDVIAYMQSNYKFHSLIYQANDLPMLNAMIEMLWMQFGPFMRVVYGRFGTSNLVDRHEEAVAAIADRDAARLRDAIAADIGDGIALIRQTVS